MKPIEALAVMVDALKEELGKTEDVDDFCVMAVMPGSDIPFDDDCDGMAWVRLVSATPSAQFPVATAQRGNCGYTLAYSVEMAVFRKAPTPEKFGQTVSLPTNEQNFAAAERQLDDMTAMHKALKSASRLFPDFILSTYIPQGPDGGVVGGTWACSVGLE